MLPSALQVSRRPIQLCQAEVGDGKALIPVHIWQKAGKYAEYRNNTAYLFLAVGMDEMQLIAPPDFPLNANKQSLADLYRASREWLRLG